MSNPGVNLDTLTRAFPKQALRQRKVGGGRTLDYVEGHTVIHRLNEATGNQWEFKVLHLDRVALGGDASLMTATVELCLPGLGCRQHIGVQTVHANGGEDLVKGAVTDALKKAATLFGVGLELYGPDYEAGEVAPPPPRSAPTPPRAPHTRQDAPRAPEPNNAEPITSWTAFWVEAKKLGVPDAAAYESRVGAKQTEYPSPAAALAALTGAEQPT